MKQIKIYNIVITILFVASVVGAAICYSLYIGENERFVNSQNEINKLRREINGLMDKNSDLIQKLADSKKALAQIEAERKKQRDSRTTGFIEGPVFFYKDRIPGDLLVCAERIDNGRLYCTADKNRNPNYDSPLSYKIEAPAGQYRLFAKEFAGNDKAYQNNKINCPEGEECNEDPINITVNVGETATSSNKFDWKQ